MTNTPTPLADKPLYDLAALVATVDAWAKRHRIKRVAANEVGIALERVCDTYETALAAAHAEVERLRTMCQLWKRAAKRKRQHHDNALAALAHNIKVNNAQGHEIKRLHRQLEDAQVARRYVPVESGEVYFDFYIGTTADDRVRIRKVDALDRVTNDFVTLPQGWRVCRLAPQQEQEGDE